MATHLPKDETVAALLEELAAIDGLLATLDDEEWRTPTALPGWDVQANVAHVIGTESMLAGMPTPPADVDVAALPHVRNDIAKVNEPWVVALAPLTPDQVREQLRAIVAQRSAALLAMSQEEWDAEGFTPAGMDTYGRFMRIRVFDCWMHEQDIRDAVDRPGHHDGGPVELVLDEMATAMGFVVGKRACAPDGARVTIALTGGAARDIHVAVDGRAAVVDELDGPASVVITTDVHTFTRLAGGRTRWDAVDPDLVTIEGDQALGQQILTNLAYTI
ncbi:maleylpyruvate isomerase family mycothiol-dependent enzyme [Iamia sp. SCSIO 61187]|uniref:maleylpyruvate isomerase family mycothiol-dependent enzyme n=1 Tax=Iamia sp. SCSIO 61187 TaxID=2722752 RepID=UPI001C62CB22|nr:maleylpyruvate isomerase family mycothiol-dependent enzyme [Iamia sp. SCSIO 61187]QYG91941.1 maleylpyruvate isomerase family mycothiol-dependent enzyme [Iamia sp. SCSIO 61187]